MNLWSLRVVAVGALLCGLTQAAPARADTTAAVCIQAAQDGQQKQRSGKFLEARTLLARCSQADCPAQIQTDCGEWSMQLGTRMPSLTLGVVDAHGVEVVDASLSLDGVPIRTPLGLAVEMDPGVHEVRATAADGSAGSLQIVAHEAEHSRKIVVQLAAAPAPARVAGPSRVGPMVTAAAGLALTGLGVGFVVAGQTSYDHLKSSCAPACSQDVVDSARTRSIVGDVLLPVGLITLAAAAVWYLVTPAPKRPALAWRF